MAKETPIKLQEENRARLVLKRHMINLLENLKTGMAHSLVQSWW